MFCIIIIKMEIINTDLENIIQYNIKEYKYENNKQINDILK